MENELNFASIDRLARLLHAKKISALELAEHFYNRLTTLGPRYNALAEPTWERARGQAEQADRAFARGEVTSLLQGIPYGAKDLLATRGIPTRWGAPPFKNKVPDDDATVIQRLQAAGAVLIGKLAMVELAGAGSYAYPSASLDGPGINPWNEKYWTGGSSSGSAGAVAAGLVPFALASETWGSIFTPAAFCGVTGLRPTWGRVSRYGAMELAWSMDKVGVMTHTARDCGAVLEAIAGYDPNDFTTHREPFHFSARPRKRNFRLGLLPADFTENPELGTAYERAVHILQQQGMETRPIRLPDYTYEAIAVPLLHGETASALGDFIRSERVNELVDQAQIQGLKATLERRAEEYARANQARQRLTPEVLALFHNVDALLTPAVLIEPPPIDAGLRERLFKRGGYGALGALCGVPSLTLPIGFNGTGLPMGLSFIGNRFDENKILQIGMAFQRATDWHTRIPPALG